MAEEFKGFARKTDERKVNTWCRWNNSTSIDGYGEGCNHNCSYCYAKSLLDFRKMWDPQSPAVADINKIRKYIKRNLHSGDIIRMGIMTDPFQPIERKHRVTYETIKALNEAGVGYLIVTKSALVASEEYLAIYDKDLAHFQISITCTDNEKYWAFEHASLPSDRIMSVERLSALGYDTCVRLSPFIPEYVDVDIINSIQCDKILVEFLKVSSWCRKWFDIDYSPYTVKRGGVSSLAS